MPREEIITDRTTETPSIQPTDQQNIKPIYLKTIKVLKLHFEN